MWVLSYKFWVISHVNSSADRLSSYKWLIIQQHALIDFIGPSSFALDTHLVRLGFRIELYLTCFANRNFVIAVANTIHNSNFAHYMTWMALILASFAYHLALHGLASLTVIYFLECCLLTFHFATTLTRSRRIDLLSWLYRCCYWLCHWFACLRSSLWS